MRDPLDTYITAFLVGALILLLAAIVAADLRDQHRCTSHGGYVAETRHGWRCVGGTRVP